jgi:hypothetical protein
MMGPKGITGKPGRSANPGKPGEAVIYQIDRNNFRCLFELDLRAYRERLSDADFNECRNNSAPKDLQGSIISVTSAVKVLDPDPNTDVSVSLSADGQDGKDAVDTHLEATSPPAGAPGAAGGAMTLLVQKIPEKILLSARGGRGGNGARGAMGKRGRDGKAGSPDYVNDAGTPGEDGEMGGTGGSGSEGGAGANGGRIRVVYIRDPLQVWDSDWTSHFDYDVSGGKGGVGGTGGPGGRGGFGGIGGKKADGRHRYPNGRDGANGFQGKQGRDGELGREGQIEFIETESYQNWVVEEFKRYLDNTTAVGE